MREKRRRTIALLLFILISVFVSFGYDDNRQTPVDTEQTLTSAPPGSTKALSALEELEIKGRAPKTGYERTEFLADWADIAGCDMRNRILDRDLSDIVVDRINGCHIISGKLTDPYTGNIINFKRGAETSRDVQIDHIVALSDAWQKGAQQLSAEVRARFANDPLNLIAVDGPTNQDKGDGDAATWLPPNKGYRCRYVARQIAVKLKYHLWVTLAENNAMARQLQLCPDQVLPIESSGL
ncbi:MAG TPA: HNH endonuclease family protein [Candidatus Saccharimonadales bacterium]|nr:HNH endonuclease family protein [Candidatus Saccharimonadales bacterium]